MTGARRAAAAILTLGLAGLLGFALLSLPEAYPGFGAEAERALADKGVANPVTAVLLDLRAYDTLLEVAVLVLAALGVFALEPARWQVVAELPRLRGSLVLLALARLLVPTMLLASGYLLYAGTARAGGAFQAAAVLAAAGVLLLLAGLAPARALNTPLARLLALGGLALFLAVALAVMPATGAFLGYPAGLGFGLIVAIEAALTVSIGAILALLYAGSAQPPPAQRPDLGGPG